MAQMLQQGQDTTTMESPTTINMVYSVTNDDMQVTRLQNPEVYNDGGYDQELMRENMNKEMKDMKVHDV